MLLFTINLLNCMMPPSQLSSCDFYQDPPRTASELKIQSFSRIVTSSQPQEIDKIRPPHCPRITKSSSPLYHLCLTIVPLRIQQSHIHYLVGRAFIAVLHSLFTYRIPIFIPLKHLDLHTTYIITTCRIIRP